ncbi:MAG: hypothetical protein FJ358_01050 [Thaumarchaeota archaeon]|nr:hypothetical protein [Nitrososphaerota archaeon]
MCTIIAIAKPNSRYEFFFFASRDRPVDAFFGNYLKFIPYNRVLGVYDKRSDGLSSGYSLKTGIYAAVANVGNYRGRKSRGSLVKKVLTRANEITDAVLILERDLIQGEYSSGAYIIGKGIEKWLVENLENSVFTERLRNTHVLTNFFTGLKGEASEDGMQRSIFVKKNLLNLPRIDIKDVLKIAAHHSTKNGICRHGSTLASFFVAGNVNGKSKILYHVGKTCQNLHSVLDLFPELQNSVEF